jgi:hypothetical protein
MFDHPYPRDIEGGEGGIAEASKALGAWMEKGDKIQRTSVKTGEGLDVIMLTIVDAEGEEGSDMFALVRI